MVCGSEHISAHSIIETRERAYVYGVNGASRVPTGRTAGVAKVIADLRCVACGAYYTIEVDGPDAQAFAERLRARGF
jgi:hypothetical protein